MTVSSVASTYSSGLGGYSVEDSDALGKDEFLELLIVQMQYQDPLNPMDNSEMIAQLAQFSTLEQMTNLSMAETGSQAYSLIGKEIYSPTIYVDGEDESVSVQGEVLSVIKSGDSYLLEVLTDATSTGVVAEDDFSAYISSSTYTSKDIYEDLVSRGYLDTDGTVTDKFDSDSAMVLNSSFMSLEPAVRYVLTQAAESEGQQISVTVKVEDVEWVKNVDEDDLS